MIDFVDGKYVLLRPIIFSCGCGGSGPKLRRMLRGAGVEVPIYLTVNNVKLKRYVVQEGLKSKIMALSDSKHGVLYNPDTKQFIDLLKAPETDQVFANIKRVANAQ